MTHKFDKAETILPNKKRQEIYMVGEKPPVKHEEYFYFN